MCQRPCAYIHRAEEQLSIKHYKYDILNTFVSHAIKFTNLFKKSNNLILDYEYEDKVQRWLIAKCKYVTESNEYASKYKAVL